jgi:hypothetical protein
MLSLLCILLFSYIATDELEVLENEVLKKVFGSQKDEVSQQFMIHPKSTIIWDITPCSPLKVNQCFRGTYRLHLQGRRISQARNLLESRWGSKLFQQTTWHYIPEDRTLHNHLCGNLKRFCDLHWSPGTVLSSEM